MTSYVRLRLGRQLWKSFHFTIYFAAAALFFHSLFTDPGLNSAAIDWFDGGKLFIELCLLLTVALAFARLRHSRKKAAHLRELSRQAVTSAETL